MSSIIFPSSAAHAKDLSRRAKAGKLRKLFHGTYTDNLTDTIEAIVAEKWMELVAHLVPGGILSFRTAIELAPARDSQTQEITVFITSTYSKTVSRGPLTIKISRGDTEHYTEQVLPNLKRSNTPRALLENLSPTRKRSGVKKSLDHTDIETLLANILTHHGETELNKIRDDAREMAKHLQMSYAFSRLNTLISALFSSNKDRHVLQTDYATSVARKEPFDSERVSLFNSLALYLRRCSFKERSYLYDRSTWRTLSFFESYFSNYIEGTKFLIDEAEDIAFQGTTIRNRHADSHAIGALYQLTNDFTEMSRTPETLDRLLLLLRERHSALMKARPDKHPGSFKKDTNRAGGTVFVAPDAVVGTLRRGFEIYQTVKEGIPRAIFIMFLITEVHPFDDGNGRVARVMMNAEFAATAHMKCIIPTAYRDNYLGGLRRSSRDGEFQLLCKVIDLAQAYTTSIPWFDHDTARTKLENDFADKEPDEGLPQLNRALRQLDISHLPA